MSADRRERILLALRELSDLMSAAQVLEWDQATYMPAAGAEARGRQIALLQRLAHERRAAPDLGDWLREEHARPESNDAWFSAVVRRALRDHERAIKVPSELVGAYRDHLGKSFAAWTRAKPQNDFATIVPYLEATVRFSREVSSCFGDAAHPADPLIEEMDPGMTSADLSRVFGALRPALVDLAERIGEKPPPDDGFLTGSFPVDRQRALGERIASALGYDFARGRQDETHHPFMIRFSAGDVRITTHYHEDRFLSGLGSTIHETGHALYEQHIDARNDATPLGGGTSAGVHESQSRLWENLVGLSRPFWEHFYSDVQRTFPESLRDVSLDAFYRAINKVQPSLIRIEADEVTYNLHVMLRFDLEQRLLSGALEVRDLPDAWRTRIRSDLGVEPSGDRDGVLQDVHWYTELIGGTFQGYTLGNLMSAQFFEAAQRAEPDLEADFKSGSFGRLRGWLANHVYRHGATYDPPELLERATGSGLDAAPYVRYLETKFSALYGL